MLNIYNVFLKLWVFLAGGILQLGERHACGCGLASTGWAWALSTGMGAHAYPSARVLRHASCCTAHLALPGPRPSWNPALGVLTQAGKVWADRHQRRQRARLGRALSLRSGARLELRKFAAGSAAPFPLAQPAPSCAAQHLLLDVQLAGAAEGGAGGGAGQASAAERAPGFAAVVQLLRRALAAQGLLLRRGQLGPTPTPSGGSGVSGCSSSADGGAAEPWGAAGEEARTELFECHDGYAVLVWQPATRSLSGGCRHCRLDGCPCVAGPALHQASLGSRA